MAQLLQVQAAFIDRQEELIVTLLQSLVDIAQDNPDLDWALKDLDIPQRLWMQVAI
jgi:hypothetical protein